MTQDHQYDPWLNLTGVGHSLNAAVPYLISEPIGPIAPLQSGLGPNSQRMLPEQIQRIFFDPASSCEGGKHFTYAILDAAKVVNLPERLEISGLENRCLFQGDTYDDLKDVAPWIVRLEEENAFTRSLFTAGDDPRNLWDKKPGILLRSSADLGTLWKHFRNFTMFQGSAMLRFYDPVVTYTILDYLRSRRADVASWFMVANGATIDEIIAPHRNPDVLYRHKLADSVVTHADVPPGRV